MVEAVDGPPRPPSSSCSQPGGMSWCTWQGAGIGSQNLPPAFAIPHKAWHPMQLLKATGWSRKVAALGLPMPPVWSGTAAVVGSSPFLCPEANSGQPLLERRKKEWEKWENAAVHQRGGISRVCGGGGGEVIPALGTPAPSFMKILVCPCSSVQDSCLFKKALS